MSRSVPYLAELQPAMFCEVQPGARRASAGLEHGGWATIVTLARRDRGARAGHRADRAARRCRAATSHQVGLPYHWGTRGLDHRRRRERPLGASSLDPNVHIQEVKAFDVRHQARPAPARAGAAAVRRGRMRPQWPDGYGAEAQRARRLLHRHVGLHRLQGLRGRLQGVEPRARGRPDWTGESYDNTGALGANTWRHVAFIEQDEPLRATSGDGRSRALRWLMSSDVCKHCTHAACLDVCPTGALFRTEFGTVVVQEDVCNGCGYCVPACPFGVIDKRHLPPKTRRRPLAGEEDGRVWKCTLCYDRLKGGHEPACAKACPTDSIQFGPLDELRERADSAAREAAGARAGTARGSTAATRTTASAASARSSCCSTSPRSTACRPTRS